MAAASIQSPLRFLFLNVGHFLDHFFMLVFATAAALRLSAEWDLSYAELIPYATPGFVAFGVCALPAGWLADKWSREGMMAIFFLGIGASSLLAGFASTPTEMALALGCIGVFAAIYHPVGLAMVVEGRVKTGMPLAINGVFGNMGVASAALLSGYLIDNNGWRSAFMIPGVISVVIGLLYLLLLKTGSQHSVAGAKLKTGKQNPAETRLPRSLLIRFFSVIFFSTAVGGLIFQSTTFALPKVFDERLADLAGSATLVGWYVFLVFAIAAFAQLVVGYLVDNYPVRIIFAGVALSQAVLFFIMIQLSGLAALLVAIGFMLAVFGQIPINDVLVGRLARGEWRSRAYAVRYIVTFSVMATAVPLIAWIHQRWGFDALFAVLGFSAMAILAAVLTLPAADRIEATANTR